MHTMADEEALGSSQMGHAITFTKILYSYLGPPASTDYYHSISHHIMIYRKEATKSFRSRIPHHGPPHPVPPVPHPAPHPVPHPVRAYRSASTRSRCFSTNPNASSRFFES